MKAPAYLAAAKRLPPLDAAALAGLAPLVVLAPHPDDESLGCGGLIAALAEAGHPPLIVAVSDGAASHPGSRACPPARLRALRRDELLAAVAELGVGAERARFLDLPDAAVPAPGEPGFDEALRRLRAALGALVPRTLAVTWRYDPHRDHQAAYALARAMQHAYDPGPRLLEYPIWGWTLGEEAWITDKSPRGFTLRLHPYAKAKGRAVACHRSQTTNLIDDCEGFRLLPSMVEGFLERPEVYLEAPP